MAREIQTVGSSIDNRMASVAPYFEVKGLFNRHATAEDARISTEEISESSLVFIEGSEMSMSILGRSPLELLGRAHEFYGVESSEYLEIKQRLTDAYRRELDSSPDGIEDDSFREHSVALGLDLIEKDCVVRIADSIAYDCDSDNARIRQIGSEGVGAPVLHAVMQGKLVESRGAYASYRDLRHACVATMSYQDVREKMAVGIMALAMERYCDDKMSPYLRRTEDGRIVTSVVYGTSHAHSLTSKLEHAGVSVDKRILNSGIGQHHYQDVEINRTTVSHRIGFEMLRAIYWLSDIVSGEDTTDHLDAVYVKTPDLIPDSPEGRDTMLRITRTLQGASRGTDTWANDVNRLIGEFEDKLSSD